MQKKYKVFDTCWHISHQYDMIYALKNDCEFYFCLNTKRGWNKNLRPLPDNLKFVIHYEPGYYDVAILHIDQQVISFDHQKRMIYEHFNELITDIPKIVINHGSPVFPERFYELRLNLSEQAMQNACVELVRSLIGNNTMVVNSYTAASEREWGFGIPIIHGINPNAWSDLPKEPRVFNAISMVGFSTYYNRQCLIEVYHELFNKYGHILYCAKANVKTDTSPETYKNFLGKSLLYLDTSFRTPMNRARTEAFLSGCCVIQVEGAHDLERWAKPGENIILVPNAPKEIAKVIVDFLENKPDEAIAIGQKGKEMAVWEFSPERYRKDWLTLLEQVIHRS